VTRHRLDPIHPGEILEEEFMRPLGLSANALARRIDVPVTRISEIVRGNRGVTADTALRLARLFGTSSELWLGLQAEFDLRVARRDLAPAIHRRITPLQGRVPRYSEGSAKVGSTVRERQEIYAPRTAPRTRDRRRIRRLSPDERLQDRRKRAFARLADRLARSADRAEQERIKEKMSRIIFGD
jgi:addiction module HigA family antidote